MAGTSRIGMRTTKPHWSEWVAWGAAMSVCVAALVYGVVCMAALVVGAW
jgi:hypothetical protein